MCRYIAHDCQANIIVVENDYQMNKILTCRHELPNLKMIINCSKEGGKLQENVMDVSGWNSTTAKTTLGMDMKLLVCKTDGIKLLV